MADVVLVDICGEGDINQCEPLFREYGEWSREKLAQECGFNLIEEDLETAHTLFRAEWPKLLGSRGRLYLANNVEEVQGIRAGFSKWGSVLKPIQIDDRIHAFKKRAYLVRSNRRSQKDMMFTVVILFDGIHRSVSGSFNQVRR